MAGRISSSRSRDGLKREGSAQLSMQYKLTHGFDSIYQQPVPRSSMGEGTIASATDANCIDNTDSGSPIDQEFRCQEEGTTPGEWSVHREVRLIEATTSNSRTFAPSIAGIAPLPTTEIFNQESQAAISSRIPSKCHSCGQALYRHSILYEWHRFPKNYGYMTTASPLRERLMDNVQ